MTKTQSSRQKVLIPVTWKNNFTFCSIKSNIGTVFILAHVKLYRSTDNKPTYAGYKLALVSSYGQPCLVQAYFRGGLGGGGERSKWHY